MPQLDTLLNFEILDHLPQGVFIIRRNGTVAFWDNRATMHCACNDYPTETRIMHRVTLTGCSLVGPATTCTLNEEKRENFGLERRIFENKNIQEILTTKPLYLVT